MYGILKEFDNEKLPNQRFYFYRSLKWNDDLEMRSMTAEIEGIMYLSGKNKEEQPVRKPKVQKPKIFFFQFWPITRHFLIFFLYRTISMIYILLRRVIHKEKMQAKILILHYNLFHNTYYIKLVLL